MSGKPIEMATVHFGASVCPNCGALYLWMAYSRKGQTCDGTLGVPTCTQIINGFPCGCRTIMASTPNEMDSVLQAFSNLYNESGNVQAHLAEREA